MAEGPGRLIEQALADVEASRTLSDLDEVRVRLLGKKGLLTEQLKGSASLPAEERPAAGKRSTKPRPPFRRRSRLAASGSIVNRSMPSSRAAPSM
jgi:phenylalanyl-tRNA synthetase alpha subunit